MSVILRSEQKAQDKWKIEDIYSSDASWEEDFAQAKKLLSTEPVYMGKLSQGAQALAASIREADELELLVERIYVYAHMKYYEDMGNAIYQDMAGRAADLISDFGTSYAFMEPEILELPDELLLEYQKEECLKGYSQYLSNILRQKEHILSKELEEVLSEAGKMAQASKDIYGKFNNADIKFGNIQDQDGKETELTQGRYIQFMQSRNRDVRKAAFEKMYAVYGEHMNTLAACYNANVTQAKFFASQRGYSSTLEAALDSSNIPVSVYHELIWTVNQHLDSFHKYVKLRKKCLGLSELHMYDVYAPLVDAVEIKVDYEQARELVLQGLKPLGEEYSALLQEGFSNGWVDVYENKGKRSGAFSWGTYGVHPYVFMNYQNNLDSVFTLAHEMGHAIHTYQSNQHQPHIYAGYRIFVAEVASICNEALLIRHLIEKSTDKAEKAYLIQHFLEQFKGTMFRQTMFAEFEMEAHRLSEEGKILTAEVLNRLYLDLNRKYFGEEMVLDSQIELEWAKIPHFYTPFYVYQYATGFAAAVAISQRILDEGACAVADYMEFLSSGSSDYPISVLRKTGVDMSKPQAFDGAFVLFEQLIKELEELLE